MNLYSVWFLLYLTIVLIIYTILPRKISKLWLLISNFVFIYIYDKVALCVLVSEIIYAFGMGKFLFVQKRNSSYTLKKIFTICIAMLPLIYIKYGVWINSSFRI